MSCLANEKWDLNELEHVHLVSMVIVSLIPRATPSGFGTL